MSGYGKLNLGGMVALPLAACVAALVAFGPRGDTLMWVAIINAIPMLLAGLISWRLLKGATRHGAGHLFAILPTLVPAALGVGWYLRGMVLPDPVAAGREYLAVPQYSLLGVIAMGIVAWAACRIARASASPA